ncbi:hypothetical protein ThidrDRAFT_4387 [Thiorhodococcus drewsii AZ1]|uniref:Uncharacterized protein n=1 Tax=Thiorhodococcus drewsii AZ1 TaxID=765913 RepID=G2E7X3_9GAMM|nr:hypothetical protein [Thiorhodococcus drewsii]EGV27813.1 hypothetical protein ThidrDRAFT_4387 [Thiorhodococcus drewsii AZ1]
MKFAKSEGGDKEWQHQDAGVQELPDSSRRRLLGQAATAVPVILTLRSGAALAAISACERHQPLNPSGWWGWRRVRAGTTCAEKTKDFEICLPRNASLKNIDSMEQASSLQQASALNLGRSHSSGDPSGDCCNGRTVTLNFCPPGALYSSQAWTSISGYYNNGDCG